jgi:hypothetical protein
VQACGGAECRGEQQPEEELALHRLTVQAVCAGRGSGASALEPGERALPAEERAPAAAHV